MIWWIVGIGGGISFLLALFDILWRKHAINSGHAILMIGGLVAVFCAISQPNITEIVGVKFAKHYAKQAEKAAARAEASASIMTEYGSKLLSGTISAEEEKELMKRLKEIEKADKDKENVR